MPSTYQAIDFLLHSLKPLSCTYFPSGKKMQGATRRTCFVRFFQRLLPLQVTLRSRLTRVRLELPVSRVSSKHCVVACPRKILRGSSLQHGNHNNVEQCLYTSVKKQAAELLNIATEPCLATEDLIKQQTHATNPIAANRKLPNSNIRCHDKRSSGSLSTCATDCSLACFFFVQPEAFTNAVFFF